MKHLFAVPLFFFTLSLLAATFGSEAEGFTIELPDGWKTNAIVSKIVGAAVDKGEDAGVKLTAFKTASGLSPMVLNIVTFKTFEDLNFNRKAALDALSRDSKLKGGIRNTNTKLAGRDAAKFEYSRTSGHKMVQYLLVADGRLWSILFVCPQSTKPEELKEMEKVPQSFKLFPPKKEKPAKG